MDQKKTGLFIQQVRKEKGLTQSELAEKLYISDRTVSKWECGKSFPDIATIEPLCEILGITANELLSGEKIPAEEYKSKAERNMLELANEKEKNKKVFYFSLIAGLISLIPFVMAMILIAYADMAYWLKSLLIIINLICILAVVFCLSVVECKSGYYECKECGHKFVPSVKEFLSLKAMHVNTTRYLKCPHCGKRTWCKKKFND